MKKIFSLSFLLFVSLSFAQMQTFKFEDIIQYRIKSDFYSDFLNILSTKDNQAHLMITQTPMGSFATLKVGDNLYSVYSENEKNNKIFKIDFEGTKEMLGYAFSINDNPNLAVFNTADSFIIKQENKKESILNNQCDVYSFFNKNESQENKTEICIDTKSEINTIPFINSELNLKGLVYRVGQNIILEKVDKLEKVLKEEAEDDDQKKFSIDDYTMQFDEKSEIENYKKQYNEYKNKTKSNPLKNKK